MGLIIAVDGPAASGKGTVARFLARHFGLPYLDTGVLYRAVGLGVLAADGDPADAALAALVARGLDVTAIDDAACRSARAGAAASQVAAHTGVRQALLDIQRQFAAQPGGAVLDGRDIGTVICPQAPAKLYVTADVAVRAGRRLYELQARGEDTDLDRVMADLLARDARDSGRADAPLRMADDAVLLDTSNLGIEASCDAARRIVDAQRARV